MTIVLMSGLWLDASAWDEVVPYLNAAGHAAVTLTLPGQGDGRTTATLDDQIAALLSAVDAASAPVTVVGHSAACALAWIAADRRPGAVSGVVLVGGFPPTDGSAYADLFPVVGGVMPFPGWEPFEGPDTADLDEATKDRMAAGAIPVPEGVSRGTVRLTGDHRAQVPVTLLCPEFSVDQAREWIASGEIPELSQATDVRFVDIDSGHWPMFTQPERLATLISEAASTTPEPPDPSR